MHRLLLIFLLAFALKATAQVSDMISVRKKNGLSLKTFVAGSRIMFETTSGNYWEGIIDDIRNDSLFLLQYTIQYPVTAWGARVRDTVQKFVTGLPYTDIARIKIFTRRRFIRGKIAPLLKIGGAGYFALNVINGALYNQPITDSKNLRTLGIAAGAFGLGYLIDRIFPVNSFSRKKHKIIYIRVR